MGVHQEVGGADRGVDPRVGLDQPGARLTRPIPGGARPQTGQMGRAILSRGSRSPASPSAARILRTAKQRPQPPPVLTAFAFNHLAFVGPVRRTRNSEAFQTQLREL